MMFYQMLFCLFNCLICFILSIDQKIHRSYKDKCVYRKKKIQTLIQLCEF